MSEQPSERYDESLHRVRLAIERLTTDHPFHTRIARLFVLQPRLTLKTMAVAVLDDRHVSLLLNPDFVLSIDGDQLQAVLLHETHHVLFGHLWTDPRDFPHAPARELAEETTVNEFIPTANLPGDPPTIDKYALPPLESTRARYARLTKMMTESGDKRSQAIRGDAGGAAAGAAADRQQDNQAALEVSDAAAAGAQQESQPALGHRDTLDDHSIWREQGNLNIVRIVVEDLIADAASGSALPDVPPELVNAIEGHGVGKEPGGFLERISEGADNGKLNWRRLLRIYAGQVLEIRPVYSRPNRRFPELVGIIPGNIHRPEPPTVMTIIDTSGSLGKYELELINPELVRLAKLFSVIVVECDAAIQRVYPYRRIKDVRGRGGTDLRPPFKPEFLRKHRPDLIIYFTDGACDGRVPTKAPRVPVVWCLTPEGEKPSTWGREVRMNQTPPEIAFYHPKIDHRTPTL